MSDVETPIEAEGMVRLHSGDGRAPDVVLDMPEGKVLMCDTNGFAGMVVFRDDPADSRVAIACYRTDIMIPINMAIGAIHYVTAASAREIAASLLGMADQIDGGAGKQ